MSPSESWPRSRQAELAEALKLAGLEPQVAVTSAKRLTKQAGGVLEFSRFVAALAPAAPELLDVELLRSSFKRLDANGDGFVSRSELQRLLERGGKPISVPMEEASPEKKAQAAEKARQAFDGISRRAKRGLESTLLSHREELIKKRFEKEPNAFIFLHSCEVSFGVHEISCAFRW